MRIGSAERRLAIRLWVVALVLDIVIAAVISHFLSPIEDFWLNTFWIWLGLQGLSIVLTLVGVLRLFVAKWVGAFSASRDALLAALESQSFPTPGAYVNSVDDYLSDVAETRDYDVETRIAAAVLLGTRQGLKANGGTVRWLMIDGAHEEALKEYASRR